ncbi:MAG: sensor N-terminal transmembrane domain-containing protein, partial [Primorskyibacter sp.]
MSDTRTPEPDAVISADTEAAEPSHARRGLFALNRSPLTRKVLAFNLIALNLMLVGVLVLLGAQGTAYDQRADGLRGQAALLAQALSRDPQALTAMPITEGVLAIVLDEGGAVVDQVTGRLTLSPVRTAPGASAPDLQSEPPTVISDFFALTWDGLRGLATGTGNVPPPAPAELLRG